MKLEEIKKFVAELRGLSQEELAKKENELKKELFDLRFQAAAGQLDQTARLNEVKKQIARVKTVQSEIKINRLGKGAILIMERNQRKTLVGRVVSDKMDKTITVVVETKRNHPVYGKRINYSKKYKAHDENNVAKEGDIVRIMETRPLSATKRFRLVEVVEEAVII